MPAATGSSFQFLRNCLVLPRISSGWMKGIWENSEKSEKLLKMNVFLQDFWVLEGVEFCSAGLKMNQCNDILVDSWGEEFPSTGFPLGRCKRARGLCVQWNEYFIKEQYLITYMASFLTVSEGNDTQEFLEKQIWKNVSGLNVIYILHRTQCR